MPPLLVSLDGQPNFSLDRVLIVVGRHPLCDARLFSHKISRHHCCLALEGREVIVRDLSSTNGTWINGKRVDVGLLRAGDELAVAHLRYRLEFPSLESVRPSPPTSNPEAAEDRPASAGESMRETLSNETLSRRTGSNGPIEECAVEAKTMGLQGNL